MIENQLDSAVRCGRMLLDSDKGPRRGTKVHSLLARLFEEASDKCKDGESRFEFNWKDIAEDSEVYDEGKQLKRNLSEAINIWPRHIEVVKELAVDNNLRHIPILEQVIKGSGAGVMNRYAIRTERVERTEVLAKDEIPAGYVRYTPELIDQPNWLGRLVNGLLAKGWVWRSMLGSLIVALGLAAFSVWYGLMNLMAQDSILGLTQMVIATLLSLFVLYQFFSPLYYCVTRRIIMAPVLMTSNMMYEAQLEYVQSKQIRADGRPIRQFRLVSYAATCQMCGERIDVHSGNMRRWGRMIGRCSNNPDEHIYSFDHVTRLGRLIYSEYRHLADTGYRLNKDKMSGG